jgi:uncharacterized membrane protein YgdD (TMEM256/DUF423 family)
MHKGFLRTASFLAALAVILGAFGAHKLKELVSETAVVTFDTGVKYQMYHALALALTAFVYSQFPNKLVKIAGWFFIIGIVLFSCSLYILTVKAALVLPGLSWAGPITPIGGLFFVAGWICLGLGIKQKRG